MPQESVRSRGRDEYDCVTAEKCLKKRVQGFRYTETTRELVGKREHSAEIDPVTGEAVVKIVGEEPQLVVTKKVSKVIAPDVKAIEFLLTNRNPDRWRKLKHVDVTDTRMMRAILDALPEDVAKQVREKIRAMAAVK